MQNRYDYSKLLPLEHVFNCSLIQDLANVLDTIQVKFTPSEGRRVDYVAIYVLTKMSKMPGKATA